ncbi:methylated-DNA--[protein]-cysteine S-methyltransferase [Allosaccharopolyspora coralli]|uniref:Methylated-DNA--protein-cysteine methyltransferase n=1 Tax=Allosaccharopolyspora coralli TaxID=2665642 RepID=A0A5Q3Q943_9PSEU|nr:methylated-DNA--[protein]-cysteine S-methyltransferase [Allosaccharopolyspora coralli]QGK69946.1 methylated-DNA--[protein]-cysteine S-methyltransferase [Allosaccharopolyspora coralli]
MAGECDEVDERSYRLVSSPLGPLTVVAADGAVEQLHMVDVCRRPEPWEGAEAGLLAEAQAQLAAYFAGTLTVFDLPLRADGTDFQQRVWQALREIPYGATASYGDIAAAVGQPGASRAVGMANHHNPISIVVPCHRVVAADGGLGGYGGGTDRKRILLDLERSADALTLW